jgi:hypothetical protein
VPSDLGMRPVPPVLGATMNLIRCIGCGYAFCQCSQPDEHSPQATLDFHLASRNTDPDSSRAAANMAQPGAMSLAGRCLAVILQYPGITAQEIADHVGRPAYEIRKRTADLRRMNLARSESDGNEVLQWYAVHLGDDDAD